MVSGIKRFCVGKAHVDVTTETTDRVWPNVQGQWRLKHLFLRSSLSVPFTTKITLTTLSPHSAFCTIIKNVCNNQHRFQPLESTLALLSSPLS